MFQPSRKNHWSRCRRILIEPDDDDAIKIQEWLNKALKEFNIQPQQLLAISVDRPENITKAADLLIASTNAACTKNYSLPSPVSRRLRCGVRLIQVLAEITVYADE